MSHQYAAFRRRTERRVDPAEPSDIDGEQTLRQLVNGIALLSST